jgi:hypothetical protein
VRLLLDHSDGRYSTRPVSPEEAVALEAQGFDVAHLEDRVYDAYLRHCEQDGIWQALFRSISNEQYVRRREKELLPLEEADREIARLKSDLERAERMAAFFEDEWLRTTGRQPRSEHDQVDNTEYACVFPRPGCDVAALPFQDWRDLATAILKDRGEQTLIHHCCCGHAHARLVADQVASIRAAGFRVVVEDAEGDEEASS